MRLTRFTDNAMRCLMVLGLDSDQFIPVNTIAVRMRMSHEHLLKVVHTLGVLGYTETQRGRNGGVRLAKLPSEIRIGELIGAVEGTLALVECFDRDASQCPVVSVCKLAPMIDEALHAFFQVLDRYTLADVLENRAELVPLLRRHTNDINSLRPAV
ncbi:MAG: Rrf2 family transcriptional regulator [Gemmatimonadaceae bacterium]|nr:Rrf2 family transcriptional regulator [Gemmatimonadaceae bacterium]